MLRLILNIPHLIRAVFRSRSELAIENLALRQQLAVLKAKGPRPRLNLMDRVFWDLTSVLVAEVGRRVGHCKTGDRCSLAPGRLQGILAL